MPTPIDDEMRAEIVALYRQVGSIKEVCDTYGVGRIRATRIIKESGAASGRASRRISPEETQRLREQLTPLWTGGASFQAMRQTIGMPHINIETIERIMDGIPRRRYRRGMRPLIATKVLTNDREAWIWMAGVWDAKGRITPGAEATHRPKGLRITNPSEELLVVVRDTIGAGVIREVRTRKRDTPSSFEWAINVQAVALEFLRNVEPYMRSSRQAVRRTIESWENPSDEGGR